MAHELAFLRCENCDHWHHPPLPLCPRCQSTDLAWIPADGPCVLFSWTRVHSAVPYYVAVIEFPECGGVRLIARLEHSGNEQPVIGGQCDLFWIEAEGGFVPAFRVIRG